MMEKDQKNKPTNQRLQIQIREKKMPQIKMKQS